MSTRRDFFKSIATAGMLGTVATGVAGSTAPGVSLRAGRDYWITVLEKLADPVLGHLAKRELKKTMPVEAYNPVERRPYTHLEAFGRLLAGIAPWLELPGPGGDEGRRQNALISMTRAAVDAATDPKSPDFLNFRDGGQVLVDTAFLAQAMLRAPRVLWESLEPRVQGQLREALKASRAVPTPSGNNWVMFAASVEATLLAMGEPTIEERLEGCVRRMLGWYKGDGAYGDGEAFHFDYYNSFVIQPMLVDVLTVLRRRDSRYDAAYDAVLHRARRYAEVQERLIAPDGTFPPLGRSLTYRFGAFQTLAQIALLRELPQTVKPAQVRGALTAVMSRMIEAPGTFDERGWLRLGFCGYQPTLAEGYISTGSLYLCSVGLLPLGLPPGDPFWGDPPAPWTSQRLWAGESLPRDHALHDARTVDVPTLSRDPARSARRPPAPNTGEQA